jgi:OOP family OmpA-OmpF porin
VVDALTVVAKTETQAAIDDFLKGKIIEFASGSAVITPRGRQILDQVVPYLKKAEGKAIQISGHTDSDGAADMNLKLSNERAAAVKQYLVAKGLAADNLSAVGYGPSRPVADNSTPAGKQQNRRIEFAIQ